MNNIDEMPAGRELDALVSEKVMGWVWIAFEIAHTTDVVRRPYPGDSWDVQHGRRADFTEPIAYGWDSNLPHYSTDIAAAWRVVDRRKGEYTFILSYNQHEHTWWVCFDPVNHYEARADTAPLAICRAALKAVEHAH